MKISKCRSCQGTKLVECLNLGKLALTGVFLSSKNQKVSSGNLCLVFCKKCSLLQLSENFDQNEMYGKNYGYMSALNSSMIQHLYKKSLNLKKITNPARGDLIIDIGSNDGTFLSFFSNKFNLIGVDPTIKKLGNLYRKDIKKFPSVPVKTIPKVIEVIPTIEGKDRSISPSVTTKVAEIAIIPKKGIDCIKAL